MPFHLESLWHVGRDVNAHRGVRWTGTKQNRVSKNSGPILSHLWAKVHEILGQYRRHFVLSKAHARLSMSRFIQQVFAIKSRSRRKTEQM